MVVGVRGFRPGVLIVAAGMVLPSVGCAFDSMEAERIDLRVQADGSWIFAESLSSEAGGAETDLGYTVRLSEARVAVRDLEFTTEGEAHASLLDEGLAWASDLVVPTAHAHPGHYAGGEVVGELPGRYVIDFVDDHGSMIGEATLLTATYTGANLTLTTAVQGDNMAAQDPMEGHSALLAGTASRMGQTWNFVALVDQTEDRQVVGAPFETDVSVQDDFVMRFGLKVESPEGETLFDGVDFAALDDDGDGEVSMVAGTPDHNRIRNAMQSHDFYEVVKLED